METIDFKLTAKNSSGEQTLWVTEGDGEYWFTLCGEYEGEKIQIDFDSMHRSDMENLQTAIQLILDA